MRVRKRPITVEAEQWWPDRLVEGVEGSPEGAYVETLEGPLRVRPGDWIITGIEGEKYPCKPGVFEKTYVDPRKIEDRADRVVGSLTASGLLVIVAGLYFWKPVVATIVAGLFLIGVGGLVSNAIERKKKREGEWSGQ